MTRPIASFEEHAAGWTLRLDAAPPGKEVPARRGKPSRARMRRASEMAPSSPGGGEPRDVAAKRRGPPDLRAAVATETPTPKTALASAFDLLGLPTLVVDSLGRVLDANRAARLTLTGELRVVNGRLSASSHRVSKRIGDLLAQPASSRAALPVVVPRDNRHPLLVYVLPLARDLPDAPGAATTLIVLDLGGALQPPPLHLRHVFGLTAAEAKLAALLASGIDLHRAASLLGTRRETTRTQLKAIFAKTGVRRQPQLVALMACLLPVSPAMPAGLTHLGDDATLPCRYHRAFPCGPTRVPVSASRTGRNGDPGAAARALAVEGSTTARRSPAAREARGKADRTTVSADS